MQIKRSSDYVQKAQEYGQEAEDILSDAQSSPEPSQNNSISRKNKLATAIGLSAVVLIVGLSAGLFYAVDKGIVNLDLNPKISTNQNAQSPKEKERFVNGPYAEIDFAKAASSTSSKLVVDNSLYIVNDKHLNLSDREPKLVSVPFENQKATAGCADAYKGLNLAISAEFETPIDLMTAYIGPDDPGHLDPENVDNTLGLALDLKAPGYKIENFQNSKKGQFTAVHAQDFGLILRYPNQKTDITGLPYISYKYRYVGFPHSAIITQENLALEEYPDFLGFNKEYEFEGYVISRQKGPKLKYPKDATSVHISEDNMGGYIVTAQMLNDAHPYATHGRVTTKKQNNQQ